MKILIDGFAVPKHGRGYIADSIPEALAFIEESEGQQVSYDPDDGSVNPGPWFLQELEEVNECATNPCKIVIVVDSQEDYCNAMELAKQLACWGMSFRCKPEGEFVITDKGNLRPDLTIREWIEVEEIKAKIVSITGEPHHV